MADTTPTTNNQINFWGKLSAGLLLIFFTAAAIYMLMAYWPNKMPPIKDGDDGAWYTNTCFKVTLIDKADTALLQKSKMIQGNIDSVQNRIKTDSTLKKDSALLKKLTDSLNNLKASKENIAKINPAIDEDKKIHLNTILLILVALMGFLGNMVHIASSFTSYVGNGTFLRNWVLWYFVKPFTAAGLAIIIYFIIRAGFLSYGAGAGGISLYGIMALSALAGLFTDSATLKLKEVFEVIFKPRDDRSGKLQGDALTISTISPDPLIAGTENTVVITGKNLNAAGLKITIDGNAVTPVTNTSEKLEIKYSPAAGAAKAVLVFADKSGNVLSNKEVTVKP
ncbi:MAG: IPT/TIG domain-containing protein [Ferruginibacter sp.]|nr:IPT/TIG domain-containing protein [Ferruginibacter sp.]